ncbi:MAG: rhomboid family intramembrane serine protease [Actinomycetota bacterium]
MLPLFDENPTSRTPFVTWALILVSIGLYVAANLGAGIHRTDLFAAFEVQQLPDDLQFSLEYAAVPCEIIQQRPLQRSEVAATYYETGDPLSCDPDADDGALFPNKRVLLAMVSSIFLHDGFIHLALNMLFLWVFGNNVEDRLGHGGFLAFYLVAGVVATVAYVAFQAAGTVAIVGASGAVAGIMGAYLVWYPDAPIRTLLFLILVDIRARWFLLAWFAVQFFTWTGPGGWIAHVAGFVFGVIAGRIVRKLQPRIRLRPGQRAPAWDETGGAGHGPYPHLDEVWNEPHHERYHR